MIYRFYCTFLGVQTEVFPLNFKKETKFAWEKEGDEIFTRFKLNGNLKFKNTPKDSITDFDYFYAIEQGADRCEEVSFLIQRSCDNGATYSDYWNGYFSINEGKFDIDACLFVVKVSPDDRYRCYVENIENEYNINEVENPISTNLTITEDYEFYTCRDTEGNCLASRPAPAGTWLVFHTEAVDGFTTTIFYREVAITACQGGVATEPSGSGWEQVLAYGDCTIGLAKWARVPVVVVVNNPNPDVSAGNCVNGFPTIPPRKKVLTVTKGNTTPTPIIVGCSVVSTEPACENAAVWSVQDNPGSTYTWSITGSFNVISSGQGTHEVTCDVSASAGTISVIETTSCGDSAQASLVFTKGAGTENTLAPTVVTVQRRKVCFGNVSLITCNYGIFADLTMTSDGGTGSTLVNLGSDVYEFTAGDTAGQVTLLWVGAGVCAPTNPPIALFITVGKTLTTPDIIGMSTVCKSQTTKYMVADSSTVTHTWTVTGGGIISGQGTNEITVEWDGSAGEGTVTLQEEGCDCGWAVIAGCGENDEPSYYWCPDVTPIEITRTRLLRDVLDYIADQICGCHSCINGYNGIVSDFFDINPIGDAPGYVSGFNYVTGDVQKLSYLTLTGKEAVLSSSATANKGILTWSAITKILRNAFQVYWFVDDNRNVRFEHITFFQRAVAFDLTSAQYLKWKKRTEYYYEKVKMPKYERFSWMEATNTDFVGAEIRYDSICVSSDPKGNVNKIQLDKVTTDILFIEASPGDIDKSGFVLLANEFIGGVYSVSIEVGLITGLLLANAHLSWANLHYNYWRHNRVLSEGYMNIQLTNFLTTKRYKKQDDVVFPFCCDDELEPLDALVTTALGNGVIDEAEVSNDTNMIKMSLLFT